MVSTERLVQLLALLWLPPDSTHGYSPYNNQARLYSEHGHLFIVGAEHSNITLRTTGAGFVNINDQNILHIADSARRALSSTERLLQMVPDLQLGGGLEQTQIVTRLRRLEAQLAAAPGSNASAVNNLLRNVRELRASLQTNECESAPCQHGGVCIDLYNGFHCLCPTQWEGGQCERDVDECSRLAGTGLGCQQGGTCHNLPGSYFCSCPFGWYGLHCTQRTYDCSVQSSTELCGHGVCVNQGGTGRGFTCICDPGWTSKEGNGACTVDKDECAGAVSPCSHDPKVSCINMPGSFQCGPCPPGFSGNGYQCSDIDECQNNNGGCSTMPVVQCINTRGSRLCGPCPPGFVGDGSSCSSAGGLCQANNGGCHPQAVCLQNPGGNYVECRCPAGYTGSGLGPMGCILSSTNFSMPCAVNPCLHGGTCVPASNGTSTCRCLPAYTGSYCTERASPCSSAPCQNGGTCQNRRGLRVEFWRCLCPPGYAGTTCANKQESCVATFFAVSGSIRFPTGTNNSSLARPAVCTWTINTVLPWKVINMTFTDLTFGGFTLTDCFLGYIEIFDGDSSSFPSLGKFCGRSTPKRSLTSTTSSVHIVGRFVMASSHFSLNWTTIPLQCGGPVNVSSHGSISSPGSPRRYPSHADCEWLLTAPYGKRIQLTFFSFDLEPERNCSHDYLEVRNGDSLLSPLLGKFCNSSLPAPLLTPGHVALLHFHSDSTIPGKGFQVAFAPREGLPGCGGVFTLPYGTIAPPMAGDSYQGSLSCEWLIQLPLDDRIRLTFDTVSLEKSDDCEYDSLEVFDGPTRESGLVGRWCGDVSLPPFTSTSNTVLVLFQSDSSVNEGGFTISYSLVCGGVFRGTSGVITSPFYPNHYPDDRTCLYLIEQPLGKAIKLSFTDFDVEDSEECEMDYLQIFDGNSDVAPLLGKYCSKDKPGLTVSKHNYLFLVFVTDVSRAGRGFQANYTTIDISCGGILTGRSGTINSPAYPEEYPKNHDCTWVISAPEGTMVHLTWLAFNVERSFTCGRDYIQVFDNNTESSLSGQLGERYCGNRLPPSMSASSHLMTIVFHTDGTIAAPGFSATYTTTDINQACGGNLMTSSGLLKSPNYPNSYPASLDCRWVLTVPTGHQIRLQPTNFSLEADTGCTNDYLEIRNGGSESSPLIQRYCGSKIDREITSMTNRLYFRFITDSSVSYSGFRIRWDGASRGCGGVLTASSGSIISPNYPEPYGRNGDCLWKVAVSQGSVIQLTVVDIDLEDHPTCVLDYIEIFDGGNRQSPRLSRICSQNQPFSFTSSGPLMFVRFRSDISKQGRGFHLNYHIACNRTLKGYNGVIESPGFPETEGLARDCFWRIAAPEGNTINITFSHLSLDVPSRQLSQSLAAYLRWRSRQSTAPPLTLPNDNNTCLTDYLEVSEGHMSANKVLGRFCPDAALPGKLTTSLNNAFVRYLRSSSASMSLFRLEWTVSGCGGVYRGVKAGSVSSPNYPKPYGYSVTCEWYISVPIGNSVKIVIDDLQMENSEDCQFDALEVYGGGDDTAPKLTTLCRWVPGQSQIVVTASGSKAFLRFKVDSSYSGRGFHGSFSTVPSNCGGEFVTPSGLIHSHNYPQNYDAHDDCTFLIRVDASHRVNLTFTDFDIASDANCTSSYVKGPVNLPLPDIQVYDGDSETAPVLLGRLCGNRLPSSLFSTNNVIYVRHKADGFNSAKGFSATYQPSCGANLLTDSIGTINFSESNFTVRAISRFNCSWVIKSKKLDSRLSLQFVLLELPVPETDNSSLGVSIFAGEDSSAPLVGRFFGKSLPPTIYLPSSSAYIFLSSFNDELSRFILDFSTLDTTCGGDLNAEEGTITSPKYPDAYPPNAECVWTLRVSAGNSVQLGISSLEMERSDSCSSSYLEVRDSSEAGLLRGVFCGTTLPPAITSSYSLWVKFRSGPVTTPPGSPHRGFSANFKLTHGSELSGVMGQISSPLYPLPYQAASTFHWRISVRSNHLIRVAFPDFQLQSLSTDECLNQLTVYDGYNEEAPVLRALCGYVSPQPFTSSSNVLYLELKIILAGYNAKFLLDWVQIERASAARKDSLSAGCSTMIELASDASKNNSVEFTSPGYPTGYAKNVDCSWIFEAPFGEHVSLSFHVISLEETRSCSADYIEMYNAVEGSSEEWSKMGRLCHQNETGVVHHLSGLARVVFRSDYYVNKTGFAGTAKSECGGMVGGPNGVLNISNSRSCQWNITVKAGRTIKVSFTKFKLSCRNNNYIILRDGGKPDSPILGGLKLCGVLPPPQLPPTISNALYVLYSSDDSTPEVELRYNERTESCGREVRLGVNWPEEIISSPNYPNVPPAHIQCIWTFLAPAGETLHLELVDRFDITPSINCEKEYLEVREGVTESGQLLWKLCDSPPGYLLTQDNALYVKYFTDVPEPKDGFKARISMSKCGGRIYDSEGQIESPGYPETYDPLMNCTWVLVGDESKRFDLNITFNLGSHKTRCNTTDDTLTISELQEMPDHVQGMQNQTYCGRRTVRLLSQTPELAIRFQSVARPPYWPQRNFIIKYTSFIESCHETLETPSGVIFSPGYPVSKGQLYYCSWNIRVPEGRRITVHIQDLELGISQRQRHAVLQFFENSKGHFITSLNQLKERRIVESSSNTMLIYYWPPEEGHRGFYLNYTSDLPAKCGGKIVSDSNGSLTVNEPNEGGPFLCKYTFISEKKGGGTVTFLVNGTLLRIPDRPQAGNDCVYGPAGFAISSKTGREYGAVCDPAMLSQPYKLSLPNQYTQIKVDKQVRRKAGTTSGSVNLTMAWRVSECGGVISDLSLATVTSLGQTTYPPDTDCVWLLNAPPASTLMIKFTKFDLEADCSHDFLSIRNGDSPRAPELGPFCGNILPRDIISGSNSLWLHFHSDRRLEGTGFQLHVSQLTSGCGGIMHSLTGLLRSPKYPDSYPDNVDCDWEIRLVSGFSVALTFLGRFYIQESADCLSDYLEMSDWVGEEWKVLGRVCGRNSPVGFNSTSSRMRIHFRSDSGITGDGFQAEWSSKCGSVVQVTSPSSHLYSPGYPTVYPIDIQCNYTLLSPDHVISAQFQDFHLETSINGRCRFDKVEVYTRKQGGVLSLFGTFCNQTLPPRFQSYEKMVILFTTDSWRNFKGFDLVYGNNDCGGEVREETVIRSPRAEESFYLRTSCTWNITAPSDQIVIIKFSWLSLGGGSHCQRDFVQVLDTAAGPGMPRLLARLCGSFSQERPAVFRTAANTASIRYEDPFVFAKEGFTAIISFGYGEKVGCGGLINLTEDGLETIRSPDLDSNGQYENNMDCEWRLKAPTELHIHLRFIKVQLGNCAGNITSNISCCDYLEIYDGPSENSEMMARYCGEQQPRPLTSSRSFLTLKFTSDFSGHASGFEIEASAVKSACGARVLNVTEEGQLLSSPGWPNSYPLNLHCSWLLVAEGWQPFHLHFQQLDLELSKDCSKDYVEILDTAVDPTTYGEVGESKIFFGKDRLLRSLYQDERLPSGPAVFCGRGDPLDYYSFSSRVRVKFVSDSQIAARGFQLQYSLAGCSRNYTAPQGRIYAQSVAKNCTIWIQVDRPNVTISLYFNSVFFTTTSCEKQRIKVFEGTQELLTLCDSSVPRSLFSTGSSLRIEYILGRTPTGRPSFDISYTSTTEGRGCGGKLYNYAGVLTSPNFPDNYRQRSHCCWTLSVPRPARPRLSFTVFDLGMKSTCGSDFLELFDVDEESGESRLRATFCAGDSPSAFQGTTGTSKVCYSTSVHNSGSGWRAVFSAVRPQLQKLHGT